MSLQVLVDTAQRRQSRPRLSLTAAGAEFNGLDYSNTWIDPITNRLMLRPAPLYDAWHTTNTGDYARYTLTSFGLTAGTGGWEQKYDKPGGPRLWNAQGMGASVLSSSALGANRGMFVSFFAFNTGNNYNARFFECGWSNGGDGTAGVSLRFWADGKVDVYKDGTNLRTYDVGISGSTTVPNRYVDLLLIPCARRELLVYNITTGTGFSHVFEDIAEDAASPVITPAEKFWFYVPDGTVDVEIAPLKFATSGYATSLDSTLMFPPEALAAMEAYTNVAPAASVTSARVFGDPAYAGTTSVSAVTLRELDGTAFVADGSLRDCKLKVELSGDGNYTPFVYGCHMAYAPTFVDTDDTEEFDLTAYILREPEPSLEVPDDPGGVRFTFSIDEPDAREGDVPLLKTLGNRPCRVLIDDVVVLDGYIQPPKFTKAENDEAARLEIEVRDRLFAAQQQQFRERVPLDGFPLVKTADGTDYLESAIQFLYYGLGVANADMELENETFTIPSIPGAKAGDWNDLIDVGENPYSVLQRLADGYATGYLWGLRPKPIGLPDAIFLDPDNLPAGPDYTLYATAEDATTALAPEEDVYWSYREESLEIEANEVRATGYDPRTRTVIQSYSEDSASKDPTTLPSLRPANWLGEDRVLGFVDPRLTTQDATDRVASKTLPRVSARNYVGEWTCPMIWHTDGRPIWRGDMVRIDGHRDFRVSSFRVTFRLEVDTFECRPAVYTGGTVLGMGGSGLDETIAISQARAQTKTIYRDQFQPQVRSALISGLNVI